MTIFDVCTNIKDTEAHPMTEAMLDKLDEMLTQNGVEHFFTLPVEATDGIATNPDDYVTVFYTEAKRMTFNLVYMTWAKVVRNVSDEDILKGMAKMVERAA